MAGYVWLPAAACDEGLASPFAHQLFPTHDPMASPAMHHLQPLYALLISPQDAVSSIIITMDLSSPAFSSYHRSCTNPVQPLVPQDAVSSSSPWTLHFHFCIMLLFHPRFILSVFSQDAVSSIITMDFSTYASLFTTTAILAPLLEETVFRGFLLTRWAAEYLAII